MKATLENLLTREVIEVRATTDSPDSSYGLYCWVDDDGQSYGQCQFGAPFGFRVTRVWDVDPEGDAFRQCSNWLAVAQHEV